MLIPVPFFTHEAHARGLDSTASGAVYSCFALAQVLAFPVIGWLAPRFGVARLDVLGSVFVGISTVVFGLLDYISQPVPFLAWSLITRVAEAVGTSAAQTSARTIIINQFPERVNLAISIEEFMMGAGLCLGPALGGALYAAGGYGLPNYALGALFFFTAAASPAVMPTVTDHSTEGSEK
ncbi:MFS-type transporter SLC18B1-like, partial [Amphibalanus amphitrite]|uniref:MFS-type transporter SLC18B1-like n=1 Tax=Amphibalanus amphitrite TaxID=1232801 RepID=UPI001C92A8C6